MPDYTLSASITGDSTKFQKAMKSAEDSMDKLSSKISTFGGTLKSLGDKMGSVGGKITAIEAAAGGAAAVGLKKAADSAIDFDTQMRKVGAISNSSEAEMKKLNETALELGASTSLSASEVADAMAEMAKKGFDATQIMDSMPGIISAAEASGEDLATVSDTVTSALNGFGMEAESATHVADVLAETTNQTAADVGDMQYTFKYAAPLASTLGISMEELAASTGIMTDAGMEGEQAGTTLRAMFVRMAKPTDKAREAMESLGISFFDSEGKMKSMGTIIAELQTSTAGLTDESKENALATIFGTEALSGLQTMMNATPGSIDAMTESLQNCNGASADTAEKMKAGVGGAIENMKGAFESFSITIGTSLLPAIQTAAETISGVMNSMAAGFNANGAEGAFDAMLSSLQGMASFGKIPSVIGNVASKLAELKEKLEDLKDSGVPIEKIAVAVLSAGPAMMVAGKAVSVLGGGFQGISGILGIASSAFGGFGGSVKQFGGVLQSASGTAKTAISTFVPSLKTLGTGFGETGKKLSDVGKKFAPLLEQATSFGGQFTSILMKAFGFGAIGGLVLVGLGLLQQNFGEKIGEILTMVQQKGPQIITDFCAGITSKIPDLIAQGTTLLTSLLDTIILLMPSIIEGGVNIVLALVTGLAEALPDLLSRAGELIITIVNGLTDRLPEILAAGMLVITNLVNGIADMLPELIPAAIDMILTLVTGLVDQLPMLIDSAITLITALVDGLTKPETLNKIIDAVPKIIMSLADTLIEKGPELVFTAKKLVLQLAGGLIKAIPQLVGKVPEIIKHIKDKFLDTDWSKLGSDIMNLIAEGLKSIANIAIGGLNMLIDGANLIPGVDIPHVPYLANGTDNFSGGFARINEGGRGELVGLPNGTQVIPHDISQQYAKEAARMHQSGYAIAIDYEAIGAAVASAMSGVDMHTTFEIDGEPVADVTTPYIDKSLNRRTTLANRYAR